jgi:hypothetical protein
MYFKTLMAVHHYDYATDVDDSDYANFSVHMQPNFSVCTQIKTADTQNYVPRLVEQCIHQNRGPQGTALCSQVIVLCGY